MLRFFTDGISGLPKSCKWLLNPDQNMHSASFSGLTFENVQFIPFCRRVLMETWRLALYGSLPRQGWAPGHSQPIRRLVSCYQPIRGRESVGGSALSQEEEDGDVITCKAGIPDLDQSSLQTSWNLQVNCEFLKTRLFSKIRGYDYSELLGN